jgi:TetR/AcrR family transcriptional regulator, regulator of cefoperazone and chloramphenicol sensitivity
LNFTKRAPRARYNVQTPARILDAAARLFEERGYAAVTLKDIVRAARVNGASVNYHFGDKRNLYRQVIERGLRNRERAAPLDADRRQLPPAERLRRFIGALMAQLLDDSEPSRLSRLMLREAIEPSAAFARAVDELPKRQLRILDGIVGALAGRALGRVRVRRMSISVLGQCVYYRYADKILRRIEPRLRHSPRSVNAIAEHIYRFSLSAIMGAQRERT